ncbi:MAG TPA: class A beta-lactamase [Rhizobacter sp.]|nr:class A beta-lactamase [Rhizobacter sp.]
MQRRALLQALPLTLLGGCATAAKQPTLAEIEARSGGKLGLMALDTATGRRIGHRADERFAMCSTFKLPLAACVLARVQAGGLQLQQAVPISAADLVPYAPAVMARLPERAMTVSALCEAAVVLSDNAAANLLLPLIGGPAGLTRWLRSLGDGVTRLDRNEPTLNTNLPDDPRDTTTPLAMAQLWQTLLTGPALSSPMRELLAHWLIESRTGLERLRAGLPTGWRAGDKTGTGERGAVNDVAIVWPPGRAPWVVACYLSGSSLPRAQLNAAHEAAMRVVVAAFNG